MKIGLFGGSFDPPHEGHLHAARTARRRLGLDAVWWLVSPQNPLKPKGRAAAYAKRLKAVRALASEPGMVVSDLEDRIGAAFTIDTLRAVRTRWPATRFVWVMGADGFADLHHWRAWRAVMALAPIAVIARPGAAAMARLGPAAQRFAEARVDELDARALPLLRPPAWTYLTAPLNAASSTALRAAGKHGAR